MTKTSRRATVELSQVFLEDLHDLRTRISTFEGALCLGNNSFYETDQLEPWQARRVALLCQKCPAFEACAALAERIEPTTGIWAGRRYTSRGREEKPRGGRRSTTWGASDES